MVENIIGIFLQNIGNVIGLVSKVKVPQKPDSSLKHSKKIKIIEVDDFYVELNRLMNKAERNFIFIAGSMKRLEASYETIRKLSEEKNIHFKILALNIEEMEIKSAFKKMLAIGITPALNLDHLRVLLDNRNCEIRISDHLPTSYFIGIDLEGNTNGFIRVVNFLYGKEERKYSHLEINHNNSDWYDFYKQHILSLWENATPLKKK